MPVILVVTAVAAERDAVADGIGEPQAVTIGPFHDGRRCETAGHDVLVIAGGVGPAAAAAAAADIAARADVALMLSLGIAGAFPVQPLAHGDVVVANEIVAADLGAASPERFLDLAELGFGEPPVRPAETLVATARDRLVEAGLDVAVGPILTLSTATGTDIRAVELMHRYGAVAEAMEGAGVAHVARLHGIPVLEVRTISNTIGDRDPKSWDLLAALDSLTRAARALLREPIEP